MGQDSLQCSMPIFLSKSDFKAARDCPSKLYYKKKKYASSKDDNAFLAMLADGGYMVEKIAKLLYPDGVEMEYAGGNEDAARRTMEALRAPEVTLFEATLIAGMKLARVDILVKRGNTFDLIEVKSKSFDSRDDGAVRADGVGEIVFGPRGGGTSAWQEYLEDVAFQTHVLRELFPGATVRPYLMMPDKGKTTHLELIHEKFTIRREAPGGTGFERTIVEFNGDVEALRRDHFLTLVDVSRHVDDLLAPVTAAAVEFAASLTPELTRIPRDLSLACSGCEYRAADDAGRSGFAECWGVDGARDPHIVDLYKAGVGKVAERIGGLIAEGKRGLLEIGEELLVSAKGQVGKNNARQLVQIRNTRADREWVGEGLAAALAQHRYPLHFIDFEASQLAVPYHAGMRPYEKAAFQWSCHTIERPGAPPAHRKWINTLEPFPNFEFARTLRGTIGGDGTVYTWSSYEKTTLNQVLAQMPARGEDDAALAAWITALTAKGGRIVDLNQICLDYYFHPRMGKRTSIKNVLDAIWRESAEVRAIFPKYSASAESPYKTLPAIEIEGEPMVVEEGTGAVRAYQAMMYGPHKRDPAARAQYRELLLQYCELDTAAMVMIWEYWRRRG
jgi:hypothetical protein